jgi:type II secretory pathway pseudopilin PulG
VATSRGTGTRGRDGRPCRAPASPAGSREAGELLVETLITVAIVGIAFSAVIGAVMTSLRIADEADKMSKANTVVRAYAEDMKEPAGTYAYVPCTAAGGTVTYPAWTPPATYQHYQASIEQIRYLNGYSGGLPVWSDTCPATDQGTQEITLAVTGPMNEPDRRTTERVTITKRDARGDL